MFLEKMRVQNFAALISKVSFDKKTKQPDESILRLRQHIALLSYFFDVEIPPAYRPIREHMLKVLPFMIKVWIEMSYQMAFYFKHDRSKCDKNMGLKAIRNIIKFSQYMTHGIWEDGDVLLQLPFMTKEIISQIKKAMKKKINYDLTVQDFLALSDADRINLGVLGGTEIFELNKACASFPRLEMTAEVKEPEILVRSYIKISVTIKRLHLAEDEEQDFVYSSKYPFMKLENLIIIVTDSTESELVSFKFIEDQSHLIETEVVIQASKEAKKGSFKVFLFSDSFTVEELSQTVEFETFEADKLSDRFAYDKEEEEFLK